MAGAGKKRAAKERQTKNNETPSPQETPSPKSESSPLSGASPTSPISPPAQYDGNRDPAPPAYQVQPGQASAAHNRNVDLGAAAATASNGFGAITDLPQRPAQGNKTGREIQVKLNTFNVVAYPTKPIYQYDVVVGNGLEKRGLIKSVWDCKTIQNSLGPGWIFDGNRLAWSMKDTNVSREINMHDEKGKPTREGQKPDIHKIVIKRTKQIDFGSLRSYLERKLLNMNDSVLEAINFLDHLMRETPSKTHTAIKRNFFARGEQRFALGNGVEAFKGVYASIRMVSMGSGQPGALSVNVDVANTTFWTEAKLHMAVGEFLGARDGNQLTTMLGAGNANRSPAMINLRKLRHVRVYDTHRKDVPLAQSKENPHCIESFLNTTARQHKFMMLQDDGKEKEVTVEQYFKQKYNVTLQFPGLPLVQMTKKNIVIPMELLVVKENQRYNSKLSDRQTSQMIKFAVTLPDDRWRSVEHGLRMLSWDKDPYLQQYGLQISNTPATAKARLLPNPKVGFAANKTEDPRTSGRWNLEGKVFAAPHATPLKAWGISISPGRGAVSMEQVQAFISSFCNIFTKHGGKVANREPVILQGTNQPANDVETLYQTVGKKYQQNAQIMFFIVPDKDTQRYTRIKRSCDCRYGVVSQVLQSIHVQKCQGQYISNVCMKVNAKLGGYTFKAVGSQTTFKEPTMIIGADVSHAAPGMASASIASVTMSFDREAVRYAAAVATNGVRVEMITKANIDTMIQPLAAEWMTRVGGGKLPTHVIYIRDGVSEGQYAHVLDQEVADMREMLKNAPGGATTNIKFTVVIASKRHHVRFFPEGQNGDRNKNPLPGTLVESSVTHPFEYDFYLNSHSAIKGTARPIHYHVIKDDANMPAATLQNMIYEHSYQYIRSTTPVSLHPAAYYAHLAAARAAAHVDPALALPEGSHTSPAAQTAAVPALTGMNNVNKIRFTMWYC